MSMATRKYLSRSSLQTKQIASRCASRVSQPTVLTLTGNLGAGKTVFAKGFIDYFGIKKGVVSPTFALLKQYHLHNKLWENWTIYHFDLYRLKRADDFINEGFLDIFSRPRSIVIIEWPEIIENLLLSHMTSLSGNI